MTEPVASYGDIKWWDNFGEYGFLTKLRSEQLRDIGPSLSAQSAFQLLQGVETLPQRMDAHLAGAPRPSRTGSTRIRAISYVTYAGLPSHPHVERAAKYLPLGPGSVFAFGVRPSASLRPPRSRPPPPARPARRSSRTCSSPRTWRTSAMPARWSSIRPRPPTGSSAPEQLARGRRASADLIRISVGLEDVEDILWDLDQAITAATGVER